MTKAMICGSRREADIELLVQAGADAIGLITEVWQPLPCNLNRELAGRLIAMIPPAIRSVLIITEENVDEICRLVERCRPDAVQLHGDNTPGDIAYLKARIPAEIIKTLLVQGGSAFASDHPAQHAGEYLAAGAGFILVDSSSAGKVGSTGLTIDFQVARQLRDAISPAPLILAGGLNSGNVAEAVRTVRPYAVDVHSGVTRQGWLDPVLVREFISIVHALRGHISFQ